MTSSILLFFVSSSIRWITFNFLKYNWTSFFCEIAKIIALKFCFRSILFFVVFRLSSVTEMVVAGGALERSLRIEEEALNTQSCTFRSHHHLRQKYYLNNNKEPGKSLFLPELCPSVCPSVSVS